MLRGQRLDGLDHVGDQRREREIFELQLHPPRLDLGEIENVIDQTRGDAGLREHVFERFKVLLCSFHIFRSISLTPMMAFSGVPRLGRLILARN